MFFLWLSPLMREGARRPLEDCDVPPVPRANGSAATAEALRLQWERELENAAASGRKPSLAWSIQRAFARNQYISILSFLVYLLLTFVQPSLVSIVLQYIMTGHVEFLGTNSGLFAAICLSLTTVVGVVFLNAGAYNMQVFGIKTKTAVSSAIFSKSMNITNTSRKKHTTGEIITLMSVDIERLWFGILVSNWLWMGPIMIAVSMALLFVEIGYPALIVAFALLTWGVFQEKMSGWIGRTRRTFVIFTSERTKLMNEILQGIRVVKLYAWEDASRARISAVRSDERRKLSRYLFLRMVNSVGGLMCYLISYCSCFVLSELDINLLGTSSYCLHSVYEL
jgi:ABC-type multidrug transport system fused ATPase/permease subunit